MKLKDDRNRTLDLTATTAAYSLLRLPGLAWHTLEPDTKRMAGRLLLAAGCYAAAVAASPQLPTGLLFEPPVFINQGEWGTDGFRTIDEKRGIVIGRDRSGWALSVDGGATWNATLTGKTAGATPKSASRPRARGGNQD